MKKIAVVLSFLFLAAGAAQATPSTQIWIPSSDIQPFNKWHIGFDQYIKVKKTDAGTRETTVVNNGITVGVLPFEKIQAEAGIDQRTVSLEPYDSNPLYYNAKIGTPEGALFTGSPAVAIGGYDFGTKKDLTDYNIIYGVIAKTLGVAGRFSVGYYAGNDKLLLDKNGEKDEAGLLLSWDRTMSEISDKLWVAVDYQGAENGYGATSFGLAWKFAPNVGVIVGYDIWTNDTLKPTATFQVDIDL
ncbi:MAG: hypothetical protein M0R70_10790 [Nitrospirae bacterium]|nr:hypothetical protein [Nitrospirota bacterium]